MARHTRSSSMVALVLAAGSVSSVAHAQSWASPADGVWFNALNWSPQVVPTGAGAVATLGLSGAYTVTTTSQTLGGVIITNPAATMAIAPNNGVTLGGGSYTLNGTILVNSSGTYAGTNLTVGATPLSFSGTGTLRLNASPSDGGTTANTASVFTSGGTLTMGSGTKLAGFGRVLNAPTVNNGTFTADIAGRPLLVQNSTHQNNSLYTAANGGGLVLDGCTVTQSGAGSMAPGAGSSVQLSNTSVTGGSLVSTADARVQVNGGTGATLNGVTIVGGLDEYSSATVFVGASGVTFSGGSTLVVNHNGDYAGTHVRFPSVGTPLNGNGTLRLNASPSDPATTALTAELAQDGGSPGGTVSIGSGVQVAGFGIVNNLGTTNAGTVNADIDGRYLRIEGNTHQNNSLFEATGGGALLLSGTTVNQAPGASIVATGAGPTDNPSSVQLSNATVSGGTLVSTGNARVQLNGGTSGFLSGVAVTNGLDTYSSSVLHVDNPGLTLNGGATVLVNAGGNYAGTSMRAGDPNTQVGGTGTVRLNASTSDSQTTALTAALLGDDANASFVFGSNVVVAGFGLVNLPTTNNGTFRADVSGRPLRIQGTQQNNHFYQSTSGGGLWFVGAAVTQAGNASIMAGQDSSATLSSTTVTGGTIGSAAGSNGLVNLDNTSSGLENVSVSRQLNVDPSGTLHSASTLTLTNNAVLTVNTNASYAGTGFRADGTPTLITGTGRVHLNASTSDGATTSNTALMYRDTNVDGSGFVFGPGVTVDGFGRIYDAATTNNGTVSASSAGHPLRVEGGTQQNNNRYESRDGGLLQLVNTTLNQSPTAVINAGDGSDLELFGATVLGGTFSSDGSGAGYVGSAATLGGGLTLNAPMNVNASTSMTIDGGGVTNNSVITVNTSAAYAGTYLSAGAPNTPINGTGEVRLNRSTSDGATTSNTALLTASAAGNAFVFGPGQSLTGMGRVVAPVTMNGAISPGVGAGGIGFFRSDDALTMTPNGRMLIDIAGPSSFDSMLNVGTFTAAGTITVTAQGGYEPAPGTTFDVLTGGTTAGGFSQVFSNGLHSPLRFGARVDPGRVRVTVLCGLADIGGVGADANGDGHLDNNDFIVFIDRFFAQDPAVDFGRSGGLQGADGHFDNNDFIAFIDLFFAGCF